MIRLGNILAVLLLAVAPIAAHSQQRGVPTGDFTISGIVVSDLNGGPLPRTHVMLSGANGGKPVSSVNTADDGRFHFEGLAPGKYALAAQRRGYPLQAWEEHQGFSTADTGGPG